MMNSDIITFFTLGVYKHQNLFSNDIYKSYVIEHLKLLEKTGVVKVYGFCIMPTHVNIIWKILKHPGSKEDMPHVNLMKMTSYKFLVHLRENHPSVLDRFWVDRFFQKIQFWQKSGVPQEINSTEELEHILNFIHQEPVQETRIEVTEAENYTYSSSRFYQTGLDEWGILSDYKTEFELEKEMV
ncbi:hypothetical protein [Flexithrix dorotheae]|uniref:hypothetical protein n=1 Tax=Flexithrix dorotheae TaxID=70993 RepID=UPI0003AA7125|nr:hypothetical protein [Flexithrix dorotheae]